MHMFDCNYNLEQGTLYQCLFMRNSLHDAIMKLNVCVKNHGIKRYGFILQYQEHIYDGFSCYSSFL